MRLPIIIIIVMLLITIIIITIMILCHFVNLPIPLRNTQMTGEYSLVSVFRFQGGSVLLQFVRQVLDLAHVDECLTNFFQQRL